MNVNHDINNYHILLQMYLTSKFRSQKSLYLSLLLALMPLSFIAGNMIININIILLTVSSLLIFGKNIFKVKYYLIDKLLIIFFSFLLFTALFNDLSTMNKLTWREPRFATTIYSLLFFQKSIHIGAPARIWTQNLLVRSQALYPVELQAHFIELSN